MSARQALLVRAFCVWTVFVWVTRIKNILSDNHGTGFKVVHSALAVISVVFAVAVLLVVRSVRRGR